MDTFSETTDTAEPHVFPLHFIWICDCSGSMEGAKINSLNRAIADGLDSMRLAAQQHPDMDIRVRSLGFGSDVTWEIESPTPLEEITWRDLTPGGDETSMGLALSEVAAQLTVPPMEAEAYPPILALVSDGMPTDNFDLGLQRLMDTRWGKNAMRVAIALGQTADRDPLKRFISNPDVPMLTADNSDHLAEHIHRISTRGIEVVSDASGADANAALDASFGSRDSEEDEDDNRPKSVIW